MKFCLRNDFSGNWFLIPVERCKEFETWRCWKVASRRDQHPANWMKPVERGPVGIVFENPKEG